MLTKHLLYFVGIAFLLCLAACGGGDSSATGQSQLSADLNFQPFVNFDDEKAELDWVASKGGDFELTGHQSDGELFIQVYVHAAGPLGVYPLSAAQLPGSARLVFIPAATPNNIYDSIALGGGILTVTEYSANGNDVRLVGTFGGIIGDDAGNEITVLNGTFSFLPAGDVAAAGGNPLL